MRTTHRTSISASSSCGVSTREIAPIISDAVDLMAEAFVGAHIQMVLDELLPSVVVTALGTVTNGRGSMHKLCKVQT
jgi:hypothetical protein